MPLEVVACAALLALLTLTANVVRGLVTLFGVDGGVTEDVGDDFDEFKSNGGVVDCWCFC